MKHYIIDGNNLIGKNQLLKKIHQKNKSESAHKLAQMIGRYFHNKKVLISLHFDGVSNEGITVSGIKVYYSGSSSADDKIKNEIGKSRNPKNIILVTSDNNLIEFGQTCSCEIIKSEEFSARLSTQNHSDEEEKLINQINDNEMFKKLFDS